MSGSGSGTLHAAAPGEVRRGEVHLPQRPVGHRQRIVQAGRLRRGAQRPFQVLGRTQEITPRQGRTPRAGECRRRARIVGDGLPELPLGQLGTALVETGAPEPDERRDVRRPQRKRAFERRGGRASLLRHPVQVPQVVGPAQVVRSQRLRMPVTDRRRPEVLGSRQDQAEGAVGVGQLGRRDAAVHGVLDRAETRANLLRGRRRETREVGHRDRLQRRAIERRQERDGRGIRLAAVARPGAPGGQEAGKQHARQPAGERKEHPHRPLASTSVV